MTSEEILREIRVRLGEVSTILDSFEYLDDYIYEHVRSASIVLFQTGVTDEEYELDEDFDISPEPISIDGLLLATHTVNSLLSADLSKKIRSGQYGVRFRTGQDEISTVEASRQLLQAGERSRQEFRKLVIIKLSGRDESAHRLQ